MDQEQYLSLCRKLLNGDCTLPEKKLIADYQREHGCANDEWDTNIMGDPERIKRLLQNKLHNSIRQPKTIQLIMGKWWYAAAAVLLIIAVSGYYLTLVNADKTGYTADNHAKNTVPEIKPGSNKAVLTLAGGQEIVLDNAANGLLSKQNNSTFSKSGNGLIIKSVNDKLLPAAAALNTISVPRGGKYDIVLTDGTKVWLNSSSSLTFPTAFTGAERKVTLTGEAYFEVAKNKKMPFKVNVNNNQEVQVLGTHFNISAYNDEGSITTTLIEGSVKVNYKNTTVLIKPGQMAVNNMAGKIAVSPADIEEVMAWKNGMFIFNNENIEVIMKKISRWYDVDIAFKGSMAGTNFTGNYSRSKSLANLLKNIELMDKVHFNVEGRRIITIEK